METVYEVLKIKQVGRKKKWKFDFDQQQIKSPEIAAEVARHYIGDEDREVFFEAGRSSLKKIPKGSDIKTHVALIEKAS